LFFDHIKHYIRGLSYFFVFCHKCIISFHSPYIRKALYIAAIISVRKAPNGKCVNPVIYDYYQEKIKSKSRKQALGAVMNKLVRIIFSVLKNNRSFVLITPEEQVALYRSKIRKVA